MTFIEYLKNWHYKNYPNVSDDDMPEHFENWFDELGARECALLAEEWQRFETMEAINIE